LIVALPDASSTTKGILPRGHRPSYASAVVYKMTPAGVIGDKPVAGNAGAFGYSGDGGPATSAQLKLQQGLAVDAAGNLFIADAGNLRVRRVDMTGTINTVAGNGGYHFSGDGGPAASAGLFSPEGMAADAQGNLFIADTANNRIRKVAPLGRISTFAGTGAYNFLGDGGPASAAAFALPRKIAVDLPGNVYIGDAANFRTRKVDLAGNINTIFGGGLGVAVDGAGDVFLTTPTTLYELTPSGVAAAIYNPGPMSYFSDIALDAAGNLLVANENANQIDKVTQGGVEEIIAGSAIAGFSGDGQPATAAALQQPAGVALDTAGNIYIADSGNNRIRKITPDGIISTVAGFGAAAFSGDGGPATAAALNNPQGVSVDSRGNLFIADTGNNRIREVLASPPAVALQPSPLTLSAPSGGKPVTADVTVATLLSGTAGAPVPGMAYTASVTSGGAWLSVSPQNGNTPGLITVTADPLNLVPDTYNGTIVISVPLANPPTQTVNVQFTVTTGVPATLTVDQSQLSFNYATTSTARSQTVIVSNSGGGPLNFTTSVSLQSGVSANWLSVSPQSGTATPGNPVSVAMTADPAMLPAGTYTGSVTIDGGSAGTRTVQVTMTITTNPFVMLLSQAGLTFTAVQNGGAIPPQTFGVLNLGSGTLSWTVPQPTTLSGGNWLSATPNSGSTSSADVGGAPLVTVSVNPAGLAPGVYYGLVKVISPGASNTPQEVVAVLQVLPAGTDVAPIMQPTSLIFSSPEGVSSPSSQIVSVYDPTGTNKSFRSGVVTSSGGNWLVTLPTDATIASNEPTEIVVQPIVNNLAAGTYNGTLTLQFSDGRVSTVSITFVVTGTSATSGESPKAIPRDSGACTPTTLIPQLTTLGQNFTVPAVYPQGLTALVADNCGNPLTAGKVSVEFSNGQGLTRMQSLNNGRWDLTWQTGSVPASSVTLTVQAADPTGNLTGQAQIISPDKLPRMDPTSERMSV
jgi:sugar lactone lactonase YvrE